MDRKHDKLDYNYITDGIFVGTNQCCQVHFDENLRQEGVEVDISLEENKVDHPFGINFYIWLPVADHSPPRPDQLEFGITAIRKFVAMNKKVYVHCKNGHGRAPTLVAAYLVGKGMSLEDAVGLVSKQRPSTHVENSQTAALKDFFSKQLYKCEECGFHYKEKELAEKCGVWCKEYQSCNIEITSQAEENKINS